MDTEAGTGFIATGILPCASFERALLEPDPMPPQLMAQMDCRNFRKRHLAYLDDTLSGDEMAAAQRHILACDACAAHDTMVRRSLMVARSMPTIEPSAAFQQKLQARLAECRQERELMQSGGTIPLDETIAALMSPVGGARFSWRSPRTLAAIAAGAMIGTMTWRGIAPSDTPLVAMEPVIASQPAHRDAPYTSPYVSPALLQAMATGNPVWPATVIIEEAPTQFMNVDYSMMLDDR